MVPRSIGSVISPVKAAATAVSGDTRYTCPSAVPERPSKLRLNGPQGKHRPEFGEKPMPMQGPQAHSSTLAPLAMMSVSAPQSASISSTCLEPGRNGKADLRTDGLALEQCRNFQHIIQRRVRAGADADLIDLRSFQAFYRNDVVRAVRARDQRFQGRKDRCRSPYRTPRPASLLSST